MVWFSPMVEKDALQMEEVVSQSIKKQTAPRFPEDTSDLH